MYILRDVIKPFTILILLFISTSCKKDVNGCTDSDADNYKVDANVNDGSCSFHGYLTPWFDNVTRDSLLSNNMATLAVSVDGEGFININPSFQMWSVEPECSTSTIGNWVTIQGVKSKSITVSVKAMDSSNVVKREWTDLMTIESGMCVLYKIIW